MTVFYLIVGVILSFSLLASPDEKQCSEEIVVIHKEFLPGNFGEGRSTVGQDQVETVKLKIFEFLKLNSAVVISSVHITSVSVKIPFYILSDGKKKIDPNSSQRNFSLAQDRAFFLEKVINKSFASDSSMRKVNFHFAAELGGPDFDSLDLNNRFVTNLSTNYQQKVKALYKTFEKEYKEQALKFSVTDLMDEKQFGNLFQVKYMPFQGFRITYSGFKKADSKCSDYSNDATVKNEASKQ